MNNIYKLPYTADEVEQLLESAKGAITYTIQTLTEEQQEQARINIGLTMEAIVAAVLAALPNGDEVKY